MKPSTFLAYLAGVLMSFGVTQMFDKEPISGIVMYLVGLAILGRLIWRESA